MDDMCIAIEGVVICIYMYQLFTYRTSPFFDLAFRDKCFSRINTVTIVIVIIFGDNHVDNVNLDLVIPYQS